jgi:ABC-type antimicrobial peptide transport system permease subunit
MREIVKMLHIASTSLLALGFIGVAAFVWDTNWGATDGGANIGLGIIMLVCLIAGGLGIVIAVITLVVAAAERSIRRKRQLVSQSL